MALSGDRDDSRKRPLDVSVDDSDPSKQAKAVEFQDAKDVASPWWNVPYSEQLKRKQSSMRSECLVKMCREISKTYKTQGVDKNKIPQWLRPQGGSVITA